MSESAVMFAAKGSAATLTMNRAEVPNALNDARLAGLSADLARAQATATQDQREGVAAFLAKRPPQFNWR